MKRGRGQILNKREIQKKIQRTNGQCIITLHSHTISICRGKLHDKHDLLLVNEDPCWDRCRLGKGNE